MILNMFGSYVFCRKELGKKSIYKYLSVNSAIDAFLFLISFFFSFSQYYKLCDHKYSYMYAVVFYDYYIVACFSSILKTASSYLNIAICYYRLLQITKFNYLNKKFKFKFVIILLITLSIVTTLSIFGLGTITKIDTMNETYYKKINNNLTMYGYYLNENIVFGRRVHNILSLILIILPNIYIFAYLFKFHKNVSMRLKERNSSTRQSGNGVNYQMPTILPTSDNSSNKELKMSLVVIFISLFCICDLLLKFVSQYFNFVNSEAQISPYGLILTHLSACIFHSANILVYYIFNDAFRRKSKQCLR
jgi:hypothetical protein